ncbi:MAG: hypothetical protein EB117_14780 [Betaproteobacteria bacterium]|nr:hypothetical protein [Betaproteobacteria bacterium]
METARILPILCLDSQIVQPTDRSASCLFGQLTCPVFHFVIIGFCQIWCIPNRIECSDYVCVVDGDRAFHPATVGDGIDSTEIGMFQTHLKGGFHLVTAGVMELTAGIQDANGFNIVVYKDHLILFCDVTSHLSLCYKTAHWTANYLDSHWNFPKIGITLCLRHN